MNDTLSLPARFDSAAVPAFIEEMRTRRSRPVTIDASQVGFAGALALQALVACRRQWQVDAAQLGLRGASDALLESCRSLGVDPTEIGIDEKDGKAEAAA